MTPPPTGLRFARLCLAVTLAVAFQLPLIAQQDPAPPKAAAPEDDEDNEDAAKEAIARKACPSTDVKFDARTDKTQHPLPEPPEGKAVVIVVRPTMIGQKVQTKLAMDGRWVGGNRGNNYFYLFADPGERYFCSKAENRSVLALNLEAGKTYYLQQKVRMGFMKARTSLAVLDEAEGREVASRMHLSVFEPKKGQ